MSPWLWCLWLFLRHRSICCAFWYLGGSKEYVSSASTSVICGRYAYVRFCRQWGGCVCVGWIFLPGLFCFSRRVFHFRTRSPLCLCFSRSFFAKDTCVTRQWKKRRGVFHLFCRNPVSDHSTQQRRQWTIILEVLTVSLSMFYVFLNTIGSHETVLHKMKNGVSTRSNVHS